MDIEEALNVILTKMIVTTNLINSTNGFPSEFNYNRNQNNITQTYSGKKWFPCGKERYEHNYEQLLLKVSKSINIGPHDKVYFHGTDWSGAISIMDELVSDSGKHEIKPRHTCTDFGLRNLYVTNTFLTACLWARRHRQAAVVIFVISDDYIESLDNHLNLSDMNL